jgi:hypothetical protein
MTTRQLQLAWKYRRSLWKYRALIKHRRKIAMAAGVALGIAGVMLVRGSSRSA